MAEELWRRYRGRILFGPFVPFEDDELAALERETGRPLPAEYTAFLRVANGGGLDYAITIPPGKAGEPGADAEPVGFDELFVLGRDDDGGYGPGTLVGEFRASPGRVHGLLPVARDGGGDTLYLDLTANGRVLAFVHGLPEWTGSSPADTLTEVADGFDAYLDALFLDPDVAEVAWEEVAALDAEDPWRQAVEQWLDHGLPDWRALPWAAD